MKLILKGLSLSMASLVLSLSVMAVQASSKEASTANSGIVVTKGAVLNIRAGKGTNTAIVGKAKNGEKLSVLDSSSEWYKVKLSNGKVGYVRSEYLKVGSTAKVSEKPKTTDSNKAVGVVTATVLNVRAGKDSKTNLIGKLKKGEELHVLDSSGEWYKVKLSNGKTGYAYGSYIKMAGANEVNSKTSDSDKDAGNTSEIGVVATQSAALNIRADKSTNAKVVGSAAKGTKVKILEKAGKWYKVELDDGTQGYVNSQYLKPEGEQDQVVQKLDKSSTDSAAKSDTSEEGVVATKSAPLNIRADKDAGAEVVDKAAKGSKVQILETDGDWYKVKLANGKTGYASSQFIKVGTGGDVQTKTAGNYGVVTTKSAPLNVRATKDPKAKVVGKAEKGSKVQILEKVGDWYKVKLTNGKTGYASSQFLKEEK